MFPENRAKEVARQLSLILQLIICQKLVPRKDVPGRIVAMEILRNTRSVANIFRLGKLEQIYGTMEAGYSDGMITMDQCLIDMAVANKISRETALLFANSDDIITRL